MTEPWTPGPWHETGPTEYRTYYVYGANSTQTAVCETTAEDARLIAAAPEMAELLEGWVRRYPADLHDESEGTMELLSRIRSEA